LHDQLEPAVSQTLNAATPVDLGVEEEQLQEVRASCQQQAFKFEKTDLVKESFIGFIG